MSNDNQQSLPIDDIVGVVHQLNALTTKLREAYPAITNKGELSRVWRVAMVKADNLQDYWLRRVLKDPAVQAELKAKSRQSASELSATPAPAQEPEMDREPLLQ